MELDRKKRLGIFIAVASLVVMTLVAVGLLMRGASESDTERKAYKRDKPYTQDEILAFVKEQEKEDKKDGVHGTVKKYHVKKEPYTKEQLLADMDALFYRSGTSSTLGHLAFGQLIQRWEELSQKEKEKYEELILIPSNPKSFFHPSKSSWKKPNDTLSLRETLVKKALAFLKPQDVFAACTDGLTIVGTIIVECISDEYSTLTSSVVPGMKVHVPTNLPGDSSFAEGVLMQRGIQILQAAETSYSAFLTFLSIPGSQINHPIEFWLVDRVHEITTEYAGVHGSCQQIYVDVWQPDIKGNTAHELFHCFQDSMGALQGYGVGDAWMIEGTATFSEHIAFPNDNSEHGQYPTYLANQFGKGLFRDRAHEAGLMWYALYTNQHQGSVASQLHVFAQDKSYATHGALLKPFWHQIELDLSGDSTLDSLGKASIPQDHGGPLNVAPHREQKFVTIDKFHAEEFVVDLPPMSANETVVFFGGDVSTKGDYIQFDFGNDIDATDPNLEVSIVTVANDGTERYEKVTLKQDEHGYVYFLVCRNQNDVCDQDGVTMIHEDAGFMSIFMTNSNPDIGYEGHGYAIPFGPERYKLRAIHFKNLQMLVPVRGDLTMEIDFSNENPQDRMIKTEAHRFWIKFPHSFYDWDSIPDPELSTDIKVHPTHFTTYINEYCMFRGWIEYELMGPILTDRKPDKVTRQIQIKEKDKDNFYVTDHKFVCKISDKQLMLIHDPASAAAFAKMMTAINATQYPKGSFAMNLRNTFAKVMSLGLITGDKSDTEGKAKLEFMENNTVIETTIGNTVFMFSKDE